jgi:hypothetical protein
MIAGEAFIASPVAVSAPRIKGNRRISGLAIKNEAPEQNTKIRPAQNGAGLSVM